VNFSINSRKSAARAEKLQQKIDAGFVSKLFPEVASIVVNMTYNQKGIQKSLPRIVNFFPSSYAIFRVNCLNKSCVDGGFDLTQIITTMVKSHRETTKGDLCCEGGPSPDHSDIVYEVAIQYS
jgi:hypothetical protein